MHWDHHQSGEGRREKKKKNSQMPLHFNFFQCGSFLISLYLPHVVKKAKGRTGSHLLLHKSRPILKWGSWSSKKTKQKKKKEKKKRQFPQLLLSMPLPSITAMYGSKVVLSCHVFMWLSSLQKKQEENSNPGHFALAVTDINQKEGEGRWELLTSESFPCIFLAFVCSLSMCEGKVSVLDHVLEMMEKKQRRKLVTGIFRDYSNILFNKQPCLIEHETTYQGWTINIQPLQCSPVKHEVCECKEAFLAGWVISSLKEQ